MAIFIADLCNEKINVNLKDGEWVENIPAKFENGKAVFQLPSGKILNEHDLIVRILDANNFEQYMVLDKGYTVGVDGEVFFAAPSYFSTKMRNTLKKWEENKKLRYVLFNSDAALEKNIKKLKRNNPKISFISVELSEKF